MLIYLQMIQRLLAIQKELGASDRVFAERLGISRALWYSIKTGNSKPGEKSLPAILTAFPELSSYVSNANILTINE